MKLACLVTRFTQRYIDDNHFHHIPPNTPSIYQRNLRVLPRGILPLELWSPTFVWERLISTQTDFVILNRGQKTNTVLKYQHYGNDGGMISTIDLIFKTRSTKISEDSVLPRSQHDFFHRNLLKSLIYSILCIKN
ncbi:hypothetical protein AVEN_255093-1 [Araneus ventricosus]|uniref:Uncharacterized protein n=1 Tax=Araneus ventricosus TaxID=182803 RepID=A0A4Y2EEM0_ARAVE|nr:hypothetical protein AVEN_255093-1 [Araneus ventricosus]